MENKYPSQITNLCSGDCCSKDTVEIPVALLSLLETQMSTSIDLLGFINQCIDEKGFLLGSENEEHSQIAAYAITLKDGIELWHGSKDHFSKKGFKWTDIKHNSHKNKTN